MILQTTLSLGAAAIVVNLWLIARVIRVRMAKKVLHGDGGDALLMQRMRAQANFIETAPLTLILIAAIEMTGKGGRWLAIVGAVFMIARVLHAFGMDKATENLPRGMGMGVTLLTMIGLGVMALLIALGLF